MKHENILLKAWRKAKISRHLFGQVSFICVRSKVLEPCRKDCFNDRSKTSVGMFM